MKRGLDVKKPLKTVLVGAGGYAELYLELLLDGKSDEYIDFSAVVDPYARKSALYERFKDKIPIYDSLEDCYNYHPTDFTIISTPINLHYSQCKTALEHGSHVLCEKPLVPSMEQLESLEEICRTTGKTLSVGFQQCYSNVMRGLKKRVLDGEFGKPVSLKAFISWPRVLDYYDRAPWAGKLNLPDGGLVRDSVATNATSHYLQNMLYLLGGQMDEAADLNDTTVECYRAYDIETFDTMAMCGRASGADVCFITTHATNYSINPVYVYEFEKACITANLFTFNDQLEIHHKSGIVENLGNLYGDGIEYKPVYTVQSILGERDYDCPVKTVKPFTEFFDKVFEQVEFNDFPDKFIVRDIPVRQTYVKNIHLDLYNCFCEGKMPSEKGFPWAKSAAVML